MFISRILDYHRKPLGVFYADGDQDWKDGLPDDLKGNASLEDVPDVATLAKNYIETKAMVGGSFRVPGEDAGKEDWDTFHTNLLAKTPSLMFKPTDPEGFDKIYDQMGRPEKPELYEVPEIDAKGLKLDMSLAENFKGIAHKHGLNAKQFKGIVEELTGATIKNSLELQATVDADVKHLMDEWGPVAYEPNLKLAIAAAERTNAPPQSLTLLKSGKPPSALAMHYHHIATTLGDGEGNPLVIDSGGGDIMTPADAQQQMREMRSNKEHPLNVPGDSGNEAALAKYKSLSVIAFPEART